MPTGPPPPTDRADGGAIGGGNGGGGNAGGPWATTGPDAAWWRGDPGAAAARFASIPPPEPTGTPDTVEPDTVEPTGQPDGDEPTGTPDRVASAAELPAPDRPTRELERIGDDEPTEPIPLIKEQPPIDDEVIDAWEIVDDDLDVRIEPTIGVAPARLALPTQSAVTARALSAVPDGVRRPGTLRAAVPGQRTADDGSVTAPAADEDPFWLPVPATRESDQAWPARRMVPGPRRPRTVAAAPRRRGHKPPRRPAAGLASLVLLALVSSFFAWVSAEPLWLAVGRGDSGTATVTSCAGVGVNQRCQGAFTADSGSFTAAQVRLLGVDSGQRTEGTQFTARMMDARSGTAYVAGDPMTLHLRWALGLTLVMLCGVGIVWATGALRLANVRARRWAALAGLAGPILLTVGFLGATF